MRCKCCDSRSARFWLDDFYCPDCRNAISKVRKESEDNHRRDSDPNEETPLLHIGWDEDA